MRGFFIYVFIAAALMSVGAGCSTTKRLGKDDVLYTGVKKMEVASIADSTAGGKVPGYIESAVKEPLSVKPNNPLYSPYVRTPLPVGLWAWNSFYTEKTTGFKAWLYSRLAKKPVLVSDVKPEQRMLMIHDILDNKGYFGSTAGYEIIPKKNPKKARINYRVGIPEPWTYSRVAFPEVTDRVTAMIDTMKGKTLLQVGDRYDIDTLTDERIRITRALRNESYYYFRPDYGRHDRNEV